MMISVSQLDALNTKMLDKFSQELSEALRSELPDWQPDAPAADRERIISGILRYANELRITQAADLRLFATGIIRYGLSIPLSSALTAEFRGTAQSRSIQVESFLLRIMSGRDQKQVITI